MEELQQLYQKIADGHAEQTELDEFLALLALPENESSARNLLNQYFLLIEHRGNPERIAPDRLHMIGDSIRLMNDGLQTIPGSKPVPRLHIFLTGWFRYAAIFLLIAGTVVLLYLNNHSKQETARKQLTIQTNIAPGGHKAILTLNDGSTIVLDSAANGQLASQGNTKIVKSGAGSLTYHAGILNGEITYNTISTPKGGQYQITLSDGTRVWLNAASSMRFPTVFESSRRQIRITGEAYIEASHNSKAPFLVSAGNSTIEVLGTGFNINAYEDENLVKTTLVEGIVKVEAYKASVLLKPGQMALVSKNHDSLNHGFPIKVAQADIGVETAWKNGAFKFSDASIESVMRQLARWYNLDVLYKGKSDQHFIATVPMNVPLSDVLEALELTGQVHFSITGNRITVTP